MLVPSGDDTAQCPPSAARMSVRGVMCPPRTLDPMSSPRILPADHPDVATLTAEGWTVAQESWAAQVDATDEARRCWEEAAVVVLELGAFRPLTVDDVPAALALDAATVADYPGGPATAHAPMTAESARPTGARRAFGLFAADGVLTAQTYLDVEGPRADVDFTVVRADLRGHGLGTALKAASMLALAFPTSPDDGPSPAVTVFRTGGAAENAAILRTAERLGFVVDERWLTLAAPTGHPG